MVQQTLLLRKQFYTFEDLNPHVLACYLYHSNEALTINELTHKGWLCGFYTFAHFITGDNAQRCKIINNPYIYFAKNIKFFSIYSVIKWIPTL